MKSFRNWFILICTIVGVGLLINYYQNVLKPGHVREYHKNQNEMNRSRTFFVDNAPKELVKKSAINTLSNQETANYDKDDFQRLTSKLSTLERALKGRDKYCLKNLNEVLPDDRYIDVNDQIYQEALMVVDMVSGVLDDSMLRPEADGAYQVMYEIIESNYPVDPLIMFNRIERLDICRDPKALNFIDTVFEAYRAKKWPENIKKSLLGEVFSAMKETVSKNHSVENLLYFNNLLLIIIDNGALPNHFSDELEDLGRRINENHNFFKEKFGPRQTRESNMTNLSDYLRRSEELSNELSQSLSDIEATVESN
ncbi:hypothetical protein A9Q84_10590 [Halobacteriovorax marinus]|uniref:Uncharacterized protein n=1 Tax=Halobacteriovorax marinus TaxID=97084 RepID=A0A1Y5FD56_9BACT|nr:hypothetical protein A9Q84_10590 [Halobacteriovorax marinus]